LLLCLVAALTGGGWFLWQRQAEARRWEQIRPAQPAAVGESAPGLDARLAADVARFSQWPADAKALEDFSLLCHANGLLPEAMQGYAALTVLAPTEARWLHLRAGLLADFGRMEEALPLMQQATVLAPAEPIVWQRLGEARLKDNQIPAAVAAFEQVLKLRPGDVHALFGLGRAELQAGRLTAARSRLQEAVAANPDFPGAPTLLASVFERLGNPAAAQAARLRVRGDGRYTAAPDRWAVDPAQYCHNPYTLLVAASALSSDGRNREAVPLLERALALAPQDARLHRQLGNTLARIGDLPASRPCLERALALEPANEKIRSDLIALLKGLKDIPAMEQVVQDGLTASPTSLAFRFEAGLIAARQGRSADARRYFEEVWAADPGQTAAPCELAAVCFSTGQAAAGEAVLDKLLAQHPDDPAVLTLRVRRGIETRDPRTGDWLRRAQATGKSLTALAELRQAYYDRFGAMP
jgi:tetratricopeptide (TPR) repeat protein